MAKYRTRLLEIMSKNLQSECRERHRLALSGLVVPPMNPPMVKKEQLLKPCQQCEAGERSHLGMAGL